jgi:FtsZ-binding cell division protein ZapB
MLRQTAGMLNWSAVNLHPPENVVPATPWDAPDPLPVMRREMKLLLIELNVLRMEVEQLRASDVEAAKAKELLSRSVERLIESRDQWKKEAERLSALLAQVPPWSLLWWRCLDVFRACRTVLSDPLCSASKH